MTKSVTQRNDEKHMKYLFFLCLAMAIFVLFVGFKNSIKEGEFKKACVKAGGTIVYSDRSSTVYGGQRYSGPVCVDDDVILGKG